MVVPRRSGDPVSLDVRREAAKDTGFPLSRDRRRLVTDMRVTTSLIYQLGVDAIARQHEMLLKTQQHIASGKRMLTPSDDPIGAAQAMTVTQAKARISQ